jgi:hypothetical protein
MSELVAAKESSPNAVIEEDNEEVNLINDDSKKRKPSSSPNLSKTTKETDFVDDYIIDKKRKIFLLNYHY